MAWTFVNSYQSATNRSAGTADTTTVTASVGDTLIACCATDNISGGDAILTTSMSDSGSNTWSQLAYTTNSGSTRADEAVAIFGCTVTTALSSGTVTFTPDGASAAKAFAVYRFTGGSLTLRGSAVTVNGSSSTSSSIAITTPNTGDLVIGALAWEKPSGDTVNFDTDTANGSWATGIYNGSSGGGAASNTSSISQYKIVTGTGTQTWDVNWSTEGNTQWAGAAVALQAGGGVTTVNKSSSDSASGTERTPSTSATLSSSDASSAAEKSPAITLPVSSSDSASGTEKTPALTVSVSSSDSASATENQSLQIPVSSSDSSTGLDSILVQIPTGLTATPISSTEIDLSWNVMVGATGYDIERDSVIVASNVSGSTYNDTGLTAGTTYTYRIRAVR